MASQAQLSSISNGDTLTLPEQIPSSRKLLMIFESNIDCDNILCLVEVFWMISKKHLVRFYSVLNTIIAGDAAAQWSVHWTVGQCVVFIGKTLHSYSVSLQPGVCMGDCKLSGKPDGMLQVTLYGLRSHLEGNGGTCQSTDFSVTLDTIIITRSYTYLKLTSFFMFLLKSFMLFLL